MFKSLERIDKIVLTGLAAIAIYALSLKGCESYQTLKLEKTNITQNETKIELKSDSTRSENTSYTKTDSLEKKAEYKADTRTITHKKKTQSKTYVNLSNYTQINPHLELKRHTDTVTAEHKLPQYTLNKNLATNNIEMILEDVDNDDMEDIVELKGDTLEILHNTGAEFTDEIIIDKHIRVKENHEYHLGEGYINKDNKIDLLIKETNLSGRKNSKIRYFRNETSNGNINYYERKLRSKILTFRYNHGSKKVKNYFNVQKF